MIFYLLQTLVDFIRRTVFPKIPNEMVPESIETEQPTQSIDCSCPFVFSNDHPPDLNRFLEIFKLVHDNVDPLFDILNPMHACEHSVQIAQLGMRRTHMLNQLAQHTAATRFYAKKFIEDLEKLLKNEPVESEDFEITREERTYGLTRQMMYLRLLIQYEEQQQLIR